MFFNLLDSNDYSLNNKFQVTQDGVHSADSITPINKCNCKEKEALKNTRERSDSEVRTYKLLEAQSLFVCLKKKKICNLNAFTSIGHKQIRFTKQKSCI